MFNFKKELSALAKLKKAKFIYKIKNELNAVIKVIIVLSVVNKSDKCNLKTDKNAIPNTFESVTLKVAQNLVASKGRLCQAVISAKGGLTHY